MKHFLTLLDLTPSELNHIIHRAIELKKALKKGQRPNLFLHQVMGMIFEKSSTRTRVSFETAMAQGGGHSIFLSPRDTQLGRGEPIEDSARVISSMVDIVMMRTFGQDVLTQFARASQVPVINALTDEFHPCQLLADIQTFVEHRQSIQGKKVVYVGDGNNMCNSYINAAKQFDFELHLAIPEGYDPLAHLVEANADRVTIYRNLEDALPKANLVVTDVWASMGQEEEQKQREKDFADFQVTRQSLDQAHDDVLFMHCLPAHRGEEISEDLLEDPRSVIWDEAENRLHAQKALVEFLLKSCDKPHA